MLSIFKSKSLLATEEQNWVLDTFIWAFERFDGECFIDETKIILPNNHYFPDQVNSVFGMAQNVFNHVVKYAGMQNWPLKLVEPDKMQAVAFPHWQFESRLRGENAKLINVNMREQIISISYNPQQINQPQDLVASFAQTLALILIHHNKELPPGGEALLPQVSELVAGFLGFGVMLANTAYQFRGGCGSCFNAYANRQAALPEPELIFNLALIAKLKGENRNKILPHLKPYLRGMFKKADKTLNNELKQTANPLLLAVFDKANP
ncbi:hypothetical protein [Pseudoalteromonas denitrificans]|uniref:Orphan protein n=1 Tax=Pseudoalteromonas denitrificans DSM 6059 TaxID=1123010 RepID=A0A1I1LF16_9GAMM|nr:hypothetical protein [Pseudoalteromonas denitrificans]SFC68963.1 hypothetical protein SAMN02745724_02289 [Pseudoalteromonas denitrificans DSM 6059]